MKSLPRGTVTMLFTDIEGSTRLVNDLGDRYVDLLADHRRLLREAFERHGGVEVGTEGDAFFVAFPDALDGVLAAVDGQRALRAHTWPDGREVRVRMGLHTGAPLVVAEDYVGLDVHVAARVGASAHGGQILVSDACGELVRDRVPPDIHLDDLGAHRLKDLDRPVRLLQVSGGGLAQRFPPPRSLGATAGSLPVPLTSFVGRERERGDLKRLLHGHRCVAVTGVGGSGKSRLAVQAAADAAGGFPDGAWHVDLAGVRDADAVAQALASALGVVERSEGGPAAAVVAHLAAKTALVVFDNCDAARLGCASVAAALLLRCPGVRVLFTSRQRLGLPGEIAYALSPLSTPSEVAALGQVASHDAVRLFVERARASRPDFEVDEENALAIAQLCRALDGLPLALELAAARIHVLSPAQIVERLRERFRLLRTRSGGVELSLAAALDASHDLLGEKERALLRRLAVFAGPFSVEAAESTAASATLDTADVLDTLESLVDKSLVVSEPGDAGIQFRLLWTVRDYAMEKLTAAAEGEETRDRHAAYHLEWAERAASGLSGPGAARSVAQLAAARDDLRAALHHIHGRGARTEYVRLVTALIPVWRLRGELTEGRRLVGDALALAVPPDAARVSLLLGASGLAWRQGDWAAAEAHAAEARDLSRTLRDDASLAEALNTLGNCASYRGDHDLAAERYEASLALRQAMNEPAAIAQSLSNLGILARRRGDLARAAKMHEESLALRRRAGDRSAIATSLTNLGIVAAEMGDLARAAALHEESAAVLRPIGDRRLLAIVLANLGAVAHRQGDVARAAALFRESLAIAPGLENPDLVATGLTGLARVAATRGEDGHAAYLLGAADAIFTERGVDPAEPERVEAARVAGELRSRMDPGAFEAEWARGRAADASEALRSAGA